MLVETKAKVGVFSIALGAYLPQFPSLVPEFEAQYDAFKKTLPDTVEIIDGGMVTTKEQSQAAGDLFRAADVDLVFLQLLTYATSYNMLPAVKDLDVPVVLVNIQKLKALDYDHTDIASWLGEGYACGAVGEMVADLERYGKRHAVITGVVEGGDPGVQAEIDNIAMYEKFMTYDLPENIYNVFEALKRGSDSHLLAFEKQVSRLE